MEERKEISSSEENEMAYHVREIDRLQYEKKNANNRRNRQDAAGEVCKAR